MGSAARRPDAWVVVLGSTSLVAWSMLALGGSNVMLPAFCSPGTAWGAAPISLGLTLAFNAPAKLASGCVLMIAAMMAPLLVQPLRHVRDRGFARRRTRATLLFVAGYAAVWMVVGFGLRVLALAARWAEPAPLVCLGLAVAAAVVWQVSPAKQWCLNRCHRRPHLAAFGAAADRDAFGYGLTNGAACAGVCWALMLLPLLMGPGHLLGMVAVAGFVFAERLERPGPLVWRWRGPGKALRIALARARMRLAQRSRIREALR